uniref:Uncharacterized protein n=1 Tax=Arundo donax TaxID=35708 RepID=A0A0A8Z3T7_ARUDO
MRRQRLLQASLPRPLLVLPTAAAEGPKQGTLSDPGGKLLPAAV